ncbi:MAG: KdsC family phosphatase [Phycisphaerae bacterium]
MTNVTTPAPRRRGAGDGGTLRLPLTPARAWVILLALLPKVLFMDLTSIELLILDVDGVLTVGHVTAGPIAERIKEFHVHDGFAVKLWQRCGGTVAMLSGRGGEGVTQRAAELGVELVHVGVDDKLSAYNLILSSTGRADEAVAYMGDDIPDLAPMARARFAVAVADAVPSVKRAAHYVTRRPGGRGAVAEVVELLLRKQKRWSRTLLTQQV